MKIIRSSQSWRIIGSDRPSAEGLERLASRHGYRVGEICAAVGCGERYLHALFVRDIGLPPKEWMQQQRMVVARRRLAEGGDPGEVGRELGFACVNSFRREFRSCYGISPLRYQEAFRGLPGSGAE